MPGFAGSLDARAMQALVDFLVTGRDVADTASGNPNYLPYRATGLTIRCACGVKVNGLKA